jgi:hypothetical protein
MTLVVVQPADCDARHMTHEEYSGQLETLAELYMKLKTEDDEREEQRRVLGIKHAQA